jgi:Fic family protein
MIAEKNIRGIIQRRASQTDVNFQEKKALAVKEKLENPSLTVREIEAKTGLNRMTVNREISKHLSDTGDRATKIKEQAYDNVQKGNEIIRQYIESMKASDLKTQSDLNLFTSSIKNQQALVAMIERYTQERDNKAIIPTNIQINIIKNT